MTGKLLHHVSIVSKNLQDAGKFYAEVLGLEEVQRPDFPIAGKWFRFGTVEVHLIDRPDGTFRTMRMIDPNDVHFAVRVPDFEVEITRLKSLGYHEDDNKSEDKRLRINRHGKAGYPQVYLIDPDNHVIEINAERL